jgi:hypothetical protein
LTPCEKLQGSKFSKLKGDVEYKIHEKQNSKRRNKSKNTFPKKSIFQLFVLFSSHIGTPMEWKPNIRVWYDSSQHDSSRVDLSRVVLSPSRFIARSIHRESIHRRVDSSQGRFIAGLIHYRVYSSQD